MALWRFGRGWSEAAMQQYLADLHKRSVNFDTPIEEMTEANGWTVDGSEDSIGAEATGSPAPDGVFERAKQGLMNYDFSDPRIVMGHYDPKAPFVGRNMLLEIKVFGFRFLNGVRVQSVREEVLEDRTIFGFRYDTLEGHIERGYEWFLLIKEHRTGEVIFKIEAHWRLGNFPNWWTRLGFLLFGERMREMWRHRAPRRLRELAHRPVEKPVAAPGELAHRGDVSPQPTDSNRVSGKPTS